MLYEALRRLVCCLGALCYSLPMKIVIATGIYPPEVGGPAYYAKHLADALSDKGEIVDVVTFGQLKRLPTGLRHIAFFFRLLPHLVSAEVVLALDTFSVALPVVVATRFIRRPIVIRTGGDFLWEAYVERTGHLLPLPSFYAQHRPFTRKERMVYAITTWVVARATVVFSTAFQRDIWIPAYGVPHEHTRIIENAIAGRFEPLLATRKNFLWYTRGIRFKNEEILKAAFAKAKAQVPDIELETGVVPQAELIERIRRGYAVILPSLTEISPNYILDALRCGKPFIQTKYSGFADTYAPYGLTCDPLSEDDIAEKIIELCDPVRYAALGEKISTLRLERTYVQVADDFLALFKTL
jgi:glycosyltransferase involved in cell wall biosynthesis